MIPGKTDCPSDVGFNVEYSGFLVSNYGKMATDTHYRNDFICLDGAPESRPDQKAWSWASEIFPVRAVCDALPCGPYKADMEVTCVVCSL